MSYALFGVSIIAAIAIQYVIYKFSLFPTKAPIFKADVAIAMLSFSLSGVLFSKFAAQNQKNLRKPYIFILSLLCVAAGGFSALKLNILVGYQSSEYGRILIFYLSAFMSVLGFTMLCFFIPKLKVISYIGSNTMPILLMHKFPVVFSTHCARLYRKDSPTNLCSGALLRHCSPSGCAFWWLYLYTKSHHCAWRKDAAEKTLKILKLYLKGCPSGGLF